MIIQGSILLQTSKDIHIAIFIVSAILIVLRILQNLQEHLVLTIILPQQEIPSLISIPCLILRQTIVEQILQISLIFLFSFAT